MDVPAWPIATERERELLLQVLESDRWGGYHPFVHEFEQRFAEFQHCTHGIAAANGTVTLEMALETAGIGAGDEVIVPAISFVATAMAVSRLRAVPVFVDIDDTFNINPDCVCRALNRKTRAIIAVHFGGPMADMDRLTAIAKSSPAVLIEDAAHAHGSEWNGRRAGSFGLAGSFSFQNSKVMTAGEGGALTSNSEEFAIRARSILDQGRHSDGGWFVHYELGSNYRISAWQAAVLLGQLERLPEQNRVRARNAARLREALEDVPPIEWQRIPEAARTQTNYLTLGRIPNRDRFQQLVVAAGVPCTPFYPHTLYQNPYYRNGGECRIDPCPVAEACVRDAFWLPHRTLLGSEDDTLAIASVLRQAAEKSQS